MNPVAAPAELTRAEASAAAANITVAVVGMGYVGLPTAIALGVAGHPVIGLDICTRGSTPSAPAPPSCSTMSRPS